MVDPMYMPGRTRTGSRPSRIVSADASYFVLFDTWEVPPACYSPDSPTDQGSGGERGIRGFLGQLVKGGSGAWGPAGDHLQPSPDNAGRGPYHHDGEQDAEQESQGSEQDQVHDGQLTVKGEAIRVCRVSERNRRSEPLFQLVASRAQRLGPSPADH